LLFHQDYLVEDLLEEYYQHLLQVSFLLHLHLNLQLNLLNILLEHLLYLHHLHHQLM
tara:strand:+ start:218 stop:388 length:171 start_codon:yes stop_codon:yes gene_type:complete